MVAVESDGPRTTRFRHAKGTRGELLRLVRQAPQQQQRGPIADEHELGAAIAICGRLLVPWLRHQLVRRFRGEAKPEIDDLLAEAALRTLRARPSLDALQQLFKLEKSILSGLLTDYVRRRTARRRGGSVTVSLQQDVAAGIRVVEMEDGRPPAETAAIDREFKQKLRRLIGRLPADQRRVVRLWMQGMSLKDQEQAFGRSVSRQWQSALDRLRSQLGEYAV